MAFTHDPQIYHQLSAAICLTHESPAILIRISSGGSQRDRQINRCSMQMALDTNKEWALQMEIHGLQVGGDTGICT